MMNRPLGRVLVAEEAGLYASAVGALELAQADADRLRSNAQAEAAAAVSAAVEVALAGHQARMAQELMEAAAAAQRQLASVPRDLALAIAEAVAKVVGGLDVAQAVAAAATHALSELVERHGIIIRVAPGNVAATQERLPVDAVRVLPDPALPADGCVIETQSGYVQAGLAAQVEALRGALVQAAA